MTPDRPLSDGPPDGGPPVRLHLVDSTPAWRPPSGDTLVRYVPAGSPATAVLLLSGGFDTETVPCLREALDAVRTPQVELLLLDLTGVSFGDSALVHELTDTQNRPQRHVLLGPLTRQVGRLLDLTCTRHTLPIALDGTP
ncbi:STAS domain-containing protein [Streptomyces griseus]|uniref:STAS domain-containing protein n=1 Tax=Streptomyces griseus TaxID=1911 RepID=UPI0004CB9A4F|nr:STAS domain-containing protein [Streptomyces griseus]